MSQAVTCLKTGLRSIVMHLSDNLTACQVSCVAVILVGKLVKEVSITSLQPNSVVSAMQLVCRERHQSELAVAISGSEVVSWVHMSDAAATEAVLAGRLAAMDVEQAGKCNHYNTL